MAELNFPPANIPTNRGLRMKTQEPWSWGMAICFLKFSRMAGKHTRKPVCAQGCYNMDKSFQGEICMSPKKKASKVEAKKTEKTIQYVAIAMIVVVIAIVAWPYVAKLLPQNQKADAVTPANVAEPISTEAAASSASAGSVTDVGSETACAAFDSIPAAKQYNEVPPMKVDQAKQYFATFKMANGGEFVVELYPAKAPITVNSFVFLACKKFYDGVTFHRVIEDFMAQGGDPTGTGGGGPGYSFVDEANDLVFDKAGVLAMANAGPDTNGSQFFITYAPTEHLNGIHTIFGFMVSGMDVVDSLTHPSTVEDTVIETITITEK
jgi:peptidylprolyl isomerase